MITILIVGLGTFCIGLLPTYEKIGFWAPVLLIFIRVFQGFGVGGEQAGAVLMTAEYSPPERRGFFASWVQIGAPLGFLLPSALFALLNSQLSAATDAGLGLAYSVPAEPVAGDRRVCLSACESMNRQCLLKSVKPKRWNRGR